MVTDSTPPPPDPSVEPLRPGPLIAPIKTATTPRAQMRVVALLEVILCSGFPTQILIAALMTYFGLSPFTSAGALSLPYVFLLTLVDSCALVALMIALLAAHGEATTGVFLGRRPLAPDVLLGVLLLPLVFVIAFGVLLALRTFAPFLHNLEKNPLEALIATRADALMFLVIAVVGGGVREEMQRAFILHRFDQYLGGGWLGLILYSLAFGAGHVLQGWDAAVTLVVLGAFWGVIYLRRRTILPAVLSHSGFNAAQILRYTLSV